MRSSSPTGRGTWSSMRRVSLGLIIVGALSCEGAGTGPHVRHTLNVVGAGLGSGTVTADAGGLSCTITNGQPSGTCFAQYDDGSVVTLAAAGTGTGTFTGWGGACSGTGATCVVTLTAATNVEATFAGSAHDVGVSVTGSGIGTVTSLPAGIDCSGNAGAQSGTCFATYPSGGQVMLSAAAGAQSQFDGWSGACSGSAPTCSITASQPQSVQATFTAFRTLTITGAGVGAGTVTSAPAGISCSIGAGTASGTCVQSFLDGTSVTLTATPASGSAFGAWSGACSGASCVVAMSAARTVGAAFSGSSSASQSTVSAAPAAFAAGAGPATITVTVKDAAGNPVAGAAVTLAVASGAAMTITQPAATNAGGVTTGTVTSSTAGTRIIAAQINGATTIAQQPTVTVDPGAPATVAASGAFPASGARFGQAMAVLPAVAVSDGYGNPVPGVTVTFALAKGLGVLGNGATTSATSVPVMTDAAGVARLTLWALTAVSAAGNYSTAIDVDNRVTASAAGLAGSPVTFETAVDVSYAADVQAIWDQNTPGSASACSSAGCHVTGGSAPVLTAPSHGAITGSAGLIVPGDSTTVSAVSNRLIYRLITPASGIMPQGGTQLPANMVGIVRAYIRQGAPNN